MSADNMILGENAVFSTDCSQTGLNNNVLVCASSGGGKTMSVMEPRLLNTFHSSLIVTVTKRRLADKYKPVFKKRGYQVEELNFVNPAKSSVAYDPMQYLTSYQDITFLAESIVKANPRKERSTADPYWDDAAVSLLSAEIAYVLMTQDKPTFADVLDLHDSLKITDGSTGIETNLDKAFQQLEEKDPTCFAVTCWNSFAMLPIRTARCVYGTLNTVVDTLFSPELRRMMQKERNVDFESIANHKTILFISTSPVNPALNFFINIFYGQMFKQLFEYAESLPDGKLPIPVSVLCDDFATGGRILNFREYIAIFREKQISVTMLIQSESQLESMYGANDTITIINNCDTYVYLGGMDLRTGRNISERLNAPLEDILYMPVGKEIIFRRGQKPILTKRFDILKDAEYQAITAQYEKSILEKKEGR